MSYRPIFYDTETTGIKSDTDRVIELAAYDPVREATFDTLINPGCPIPEAASKIHHITDSMVANKPSFHDILDDFTTFCDGKVVLIAHNNDGFDIHFLRAEYKRCQQDLPNWSFFDTLKWARRYRSDLPRHSLQHLREHYGFKENNAHRALEDVKILYQIYLAMVDDLSIEEAVQLMQITKKFTSMPFGKHQGKLFKDIPKNYVRWLEESSALNKPENQDLRKAFETAGLLSIPVQ